MTAWPVTHYRACALAGWYLAERLRGFSPHSAVQIAKQRQQLVDHHARALALIQEFLATREVVLLATIQRDGAWTEWSSPRVA